MAATPAALPEDRTRRIALVLLVNADMVNCSLIPCANT
jgi:hypothetical protein